MILRERSAQAKLTGKIFGQARSAFAWLGESDNIIDLTFDQIGKHALLDLDPSKMSDTYSERAFGGNDDFPSGFSLSILVTAKSDGRTAKSSLEDRYPYVY